MRISTTELKTNIGKYLNLLDKEDIIITRNGRKIARVIKEEDDALSEVRSLFGILADSEYAHMTDGEIKGVIREERSNRYDRAD